MAACGCNVDEQRGMIQFVHCHVVSALLNDESIVQRFRI
jgi:hypothetical protein